jgi:hypothetical protein
MVSGQHIVVAIGGGNFVGGTSHCAARLVGST